MSATNDLYRHAKTRIPGGTQLLSKRPEMFLPEQWPAYAQRARGCEVWDLDGRRYLDMTITAIGACPLGFADADVNAAVKAVVDSGSMCTLNPPEEVALADRLCRLHPWADMARFARSGGEAMTIAVRIARASTGRDVVAVCGYHGWHDWYLAANLASDRSLDGHLLPGLDPAGVPRGLLGTSLPFAYNHPEELDAIVAEHGDRLAAIVMEPVRYSNPAPGFLEHCRAAARKSGAVLIFDEITAGFRTNVGGAHLQFGIDPDIAVFAKALGNGFPISAIIGRRETMQAAQRTFISSTNWTDRVGPAAALATLSKLEDQRVPEHLIAVGNQVRRIWAAASEQHGIRITVKGLPPLSTFSIDHGDDSLALSTLFTQTMLREGVLASKGFYATWAHRETHCAEYEAAANKAFGEMRRALDSGEPARFVDGPLQHNGFRRLA